MSSSHGHRSKRRLITLLSLTLLLVAGGAAAFVYLRRQPVVRPETPTTIVKQPGKPDVKTVNGRYLLNGTVTWARAVEQSAHGDYAQPFSQLYTLQRDTYDAWSTDFECPITNNVVPYAV